MGDVYAIRRLHYCQGWSVRRISRELGHTRKTVRRALRGGNDGRYSLSVPRARPVIGPHMATIRDLLEAETADGGWSKQRLTAAAVYRVLREEHDYAGSEPTVRRAVRDARLAIGLPLREAYVPLEYDPGVDAQVDFFEADVEVAARRQRVTVLLMRACFSARPFVFRVPTENGEALLEGLAAGFEHFGGVFHCLWFDNLTAAVTQVLQGRSRVVRRQFEAFRLHYGFVAEFCAVAKGNEKGGVENGGKYLRRSGLVPVPKVADLAALDEHLAAWMKAEDVRVPSRKDRTVGESWALEVVKLLPLPRAVFDVGQPLQRKVSDYSLVRVDTNDYSVPVSLVGAHVTVKRYAERLEIHGPSGLVATHPRLYGRNLASFVLDHYLPLLKAKARAFDRAAPVRQARKDWPPAYELLLRVLRDCRGDAGGTREFVEVLLLHRRHSCDWVHEAVRRAVTHAEPSLAAVRAYLDLERRGADPPEAMAAGTLARYPNVEVADADIGRYDHLCAGVRS